MVQNPTARAMLKKEMIKMNKFFRETDKKIKAQEKFERALMKRLNRKVKRRKR